MRWECIRSTLARGPALGVAGAMVVVAVSVANEGGERNSIYYGDEGSMRGLAGNYAQALNCRFRERKHSSLSTRRRSRSRPCDHPDPYPLMIYLFIVHTAWSP